MVIGCCSVKFYLHGNNSLKGKRRVIRSIKDRLKNDFNVSNMKKPAEKSFAQLGYPGRLVAVEGIDGSGKSTLLNRSRL